ncbi:MAG: branched-chain amino acid ABC transporter permease [Phycisphaerales bacterium]
MTDFLQTLTTAVAMGSLFALIALGYTMVYGILKFINFAHSDLVVLGAWVAFALATKALPALGVSGPAPWWVGGLVLVASMAACALVGFLIEYLAYRPLRRAPRLNVLITAIGVSLLLQNTGQLPFVFGARPAAMPALVPVEPWTLGGVRINPVDVVVTVTALVLMLALQFLVFRTKLGTAMRAVSFNVVNASLVGINVNFVISFTFMLGSALAAAAGFLFAVKYNLQQTAHPQWVMLGLTAFVAAVVGGIGNIRGAMLGAFLISFIQQFGIYALLKLEYDNAAGLKDVYVFVILIGVLLVKPEGLLGTPTREKV